MDSENEQSYHQVKTQRFVLDNNHKCQIKRNHSSLPASAILFQKLCRLFQISSGSDSRASKSGRRPIQRTGIVHPIPAALPLAQTNRLIVILYKLLFFTKQQISDSSKLKEFADDNFKFVENG